MSAAQGKALENALVANPDDLAAHAAYADYLTEQGDPRGEFIQVQLALEDEGKPARERKKLQEREKQLLKKHGRTWLGDLAAHLWKQKPDDVQYSWARGWLHHIGLRLLTGPLARALAAAPQVRLLSSLAIADVYNMFHFLGEQEDAAEGWEGDYPGLEPLVQSPHLANVRQLVIGGFHDLRDNAFPYTALSLVELDGVVPLVQTMPHLEHLVLEGRLREPKALFGLKTLTNLRTLHLCLSQEYPLEVLAKNRALARLSNILFHPQDGEEPVITLAGVRALVRSPHLKCLTKLRLHLTDIGDRGCEVIVQSGVLKRLKVLDLGFGSMTDAGARILAACPELRNLELLDVQRNAMTKKGVALLRKTGVEVHAEEQHDPGDTSYLFEGEFE